MLIASNFMLWTIVALLTIAVLALARRTAALDARLDVAARTEADTNAPDDRRSDTQTG